MIPRSAGVLIPLFSLRSENDLGRGEIIHMRSMIDLALQMGHRVIQLLPLDETAPDISSPYSALSLFAIDPLYISPPYVPSEPDRSAVKHHETGPVPRATYVAAKSALLERSYAAFRSRRRMRENRALDSFIEEQSWWLDDYSLFRALKDRFNFLPWDRWPAELANRDPDALAGARRELADTIRKYEYFQFVAHRQWCGIRDYARERGALIGGDLAFSAGRDSDVVWANREDYDLSRTVGAPPDAFSATGQRWGLPMPNWQRARQDGFKLWRARVRHASAMYDLLRIDHVVGLYRTFSFGAEENSEGKFTPSHEDDQRAQGEAVIAALQQEAPNARFIAEDLGTVPPWVRASLTHLGLPGYKVMQWEREWDTPERRYIPPAQYSELSMATTGTHDTEAFTVWWHEQPIDERTKLVESLGLNGRINPHDPMGMPALDAIIETIYAAPSILSIMPIQDLYGWSQRINTPGTVGSDNWTWRLPIPLERVAQSHSMQARIARLREIAIWSQRFSSAD